MSKSRKDNKGRVLRKGESQRKDDLRYIYQYTDPSGARRVIYANNPSDRVMAEIKQGAGKNKGIRRALTIENPSNSYDGCGMSSISVLRWIFMQADRCIRLTEKERR